VLLSADPLAGAPVEALRVETTVVGGEIAWQRGQTPSGP